MTFERRHLNIALALLLLAIGYNIYRFVTSRPSVQPQQPLMAGIDVSPPPPATPSPATVDALAIPAPPAIDLATTPVWLRDPLLAPGESRRPVAAAAPAAEIGPDPTVRTILFSPQRSLAIVDNRIVHVGDMVSNGRIVEIDHDAIYVQTSAGERRRIALRRGPSLQERIRQQ